MEIQGKISILINREYTDIEVRDDKANITFAKIRLTQEELSMALSRQMYTPCTIEIRGLDLVGKKHEVSSFEFELPDWYKRRDSQDVELKKYVDSFLNDGWVSDNYFGSQNSFFEKSGKKMCRTTIRRWVNE